MAPYNRQRNSTILRPDRRVGTLWPPQSGADLCSGQRQPVARSATVRDAIAKYRASTRERSKFINRLSEVLLDTPLWRVCFDQVFVDEQARQHYPGCKASTLKRNFYNPLLAALKTAAEANLCPTHKIKKPKVDLNRRDWWLYPSEFARLIAEAAVHLRPMLLFAVETGAKISEVLYLTWDDVDFDHGEVCVGFRLIKNSRVIALLSGLRRQQAMIQVEGQTVFRRPDGKSYAPKEYSGGQIKTALRTACRKAQINDFRFGDLRLTYAVWRYAEHSNLKQLKAETVPRGTLKQLANLAAADFHRVRQELAQLATKLWTKESDV